MAISKRTGREYMSRREAGYRNTNKRPKREKFPKGYDRWGQPNICGVIGEDGKECRKPIAEGIGYRCEYHQELHEQQRSSKRAPTEGGGST